MRKNTKETVVRRGLSGRFRTGVVENPLKKKRATAVVGTPLNPKIDLLRSFRDRWLLKNPLGRATVHTYYELSPLIARRAWNSRRLRKILRRIVAEPALRIAQTFLRK